MATSNDRYLRTYMPMPDNDKGEKQEMEVEVYYSLGGHNYWTGGTTRRGIWLSFWPVQRSASSTTRAVPDDRGRRILLLEQKRRNDKLGYQWAQFIKNNIDAIAEAAIAQNWPGVAQVVRDGLKEAA